MLCRKSRAKKHITSHRKKHHSDDMDVYHVKGEKVCHVGMEGREASFDEEESLHEEKEVDSGGAGEDADQKAHHAGGEDGSAAHVLEEGHVDSDEQSLCKLKTS